MGLVKEVFEHLRSKKVYFVAFLTELWPNIDETYKKVTHFSYDKFIGRESGPLKVWICTLNQKRDKERLLM